MANNQILNRVGNYTEYIVCAALSTVGATIANQFIVPKIQEIHEKKCKATKNPIGFKAD